MREALVARGAPVDKLVLVEYDASFCKLLERRFPGAQILRGLCPDVGLFYLLAARSGPGRARELLLQTSMSIMDITTACGFQSPPLTSTEMGLAAPVSS